MKYHNKYLKYKTKYIEAKNEYNNLLKNCNNCNNKLCNCNEQSGGGDGQCGGSNEQYGGSDEENDNNAKLYLFKADWCGHCRNFMPTWDKVKANFKDKINIKTYDADNNKNELTKYNIQGFPTLLLINNKNKNIEYNGVRDINSITEFINTYI